MTPTQQLLADLSPRRDELYRRAAARGADQAEFTLQQALQKSLASAPPDPQQFLHTLESLLPPAPDPPNTPLPMPADVWARIAAAIQLENARSSPPHPDSPHAPDPVLAPKKSRTPNLNPQPLATTRQLLILAAIAILLTLAIAVFLAARSSNPAFTPASRP